MTREKSRPLSNNKSQARSPGWAIAVLALPVLGEQFGNILVGLVDTYLAGKFSKEAIAAVGIASYVGWLATMLSGFVGVGATALVARSIGARDRTQANDLTNQAMGLAGYLGIGLTLTLLALAGVIPNLMGLKGEAAGVASQYLRIDAFGQFLYVYMLVGAACLRGAGDTRTPMLIMILINIVNLVISVTLSMGLGPVQPMGVIGIVIGTVIARSLGGMIMLYVLFKGRSHLQLSAGKMGFERKTALRLLHIGGPAGLDSILMWSGHFIFLTFLTRVSDDPELGLAACAAHMIGVRTESFTYLPAMAWGIAAATLVGQTLGTGDPRLARRTGHLAVLQLVPYAVIVSIIYYFAADAIFGFWSSDALVREQGASALRLVAIAQPSLIIMIIYTSALRGAGDTRYPLLINACGVFLVRIPLAYLFGVWLQGGLFGAWIGLTSDLIFRSFFVAARFAFGKWNQKIL